ncbi:MAG: SIR2 family protein [Candidatus Margulisiibacteriota bacterium]
MENKIFDPSTKNQLPDDIYFIPTIPPQIKDAAANGKLVVFYGAGVSRIIGCDGWEELSNRLIDEAFERKLISFFEKTRAKEKYPPRKAISIIKDQLEPETFKNILLEALTEKNDKKKQFPIYDKLIRLRGIYVTTNIDSCFDGKFDSEMIFATPSEIATATIRNNSLFHLHGSIREGCPIILTTSEYLFHYNNDQIQQFLRRIFSGDFTVLFIGYSMSEIEVLDYILLKGKGSSKEHIVGNYLLLPFFEAEKAMLKHERCYFSQLNTMVIPYAIDKKGYEQLYDVIESWEREINIASPFLYKTFDFIENNAKEYNASNVAEVLQLLKNDQEFYRHFFKHVSTIDWFTMLKQKGYFLPIEAPKPVETDQKGAYMIPEWEILQYLERISLQSLAGQTDICNEILTVIKDTTEYHIKNDKVLDNFRIWQYFIKILGNLPAVATIDYLNKYNIDLGKDWIREWLNSKFDNGSPSSEIAENLLPKFLAPREEDVDIAEKILKELVEIKLKPMAETSKELSSREYEFVTIVDPYWLNKAFDDSREKIGRLCSKNLEYHMADKIKQIILYEGNRYGFDIVEDVFELVINRVGNESGMIEEFNFKCKINKIIPESQEDSSKTKKALFGIFERKKETIAEWPINNCKTQECFVNSIYTELLNIKDIKTAEMADVIKRRLGDMYDELYDDMSYIWMKSIDANDELGATEVKQLLTRLLRDLLIVKCQENKSEGKEILESMIQDYRFAIFKRMALYLINTYWHEYRALFDMYFTGDIAKDMIYKTDYEVEMFNLFKGHSRDFNEEQINTIEKLIEEGHPYYRREENKGLMNSWKLQKYLPLKDDPRFKNRYHELAKAVGKEPKEPDKKFIKALWGGEQSSLKKEEIIKMENTRLYEYLQSFKGDDGEGPTKEGLGNALRSAVIESPAKFVDEIMMFKDANYLYVHNIIYGLVEAWKNKKEFDWKKVFDFAVEYINKPTFWEEAKAGQGADYLNTHIWVFSSMADLIEEGSKDNSWAFPETYLAQANSLLDMMFDKSEPAKESSYDNAVTRVLSTTLGKIIKSKILLMLRKARIDKRNNKQKDDSYYSVEYEKLFKKAEIAVDEAYALFGQYMPNMFYLNRSWAEGKVKEFESIPQEDIRWKSFFEGYLFGGRLYDDLYELMRTHYERAIGYDFGEGYAREKLLDHISIGYIRGKESLDDQNSLFRKVIDRWQYKELREIILYLWSQRDYLKISNDSEELKEIKPAKQRVLDLWKWFYDNKAPVENKLKGDYPKLMSDLSRLTCLLDEINEENSKWLLQIAPYVGVAFNSPFFIKSLLPLIKDVDSAKHSGKIYLAMLTAITPDYPRETIQALVESLYKYDNEEDVVKICNIYGSRGHEFLREIYEKHKNS